MILKIRNEGWAHKLAHKGHRIVPSGRGTPEAAFKIIVLIGRDIIRSADPRPCPRNECVN